MHLDEKTKNSSVVYDGKIFKIKKDTVILEDNSEAVREFVVCLLYTSPSPRDS